MSGAWSNHSIHTQALNTFNKTGRLGVKRELISFHTRSTQNSNDFALHIKTSIIYPGAQPTETYEFYSVDLTGKITQLQNETVPVIVSPIGGWSEEIIIQPEEVIIYNINNHLPQPLGYHYEILSYYKQIVNGTNYAVEISGTVVYPNAKPSIKWLYFYVNNNLILDPTSIRIEDHPPV